MLLPRRGGGGGGGGSRGGLARARRGGARAVGEVVERAGDAVHEAEMLRARTSAGHAVVEPHTGNEGNGDIAVRVVDGVLRHRDGGPRETQCTRGAFVGISPPSVNGKTRSQNRETLASAAAPGEKRTNRWAIGVRSAPQCAAKAPRRRPCERWPRRCGLPRAALDRYSRSRVGAPDRGQCPPRSA